MPRPKRKNLRLRSFDYTSAGAYLFTVCVAGRRCLLGYVEDDSVVLSQEGGIVAACLLETPRHFAVELDEHVVMPNHVHAIVFIHARARHASPLRLGNVVGAFKSASSRRAGRGLWQRGYHDRVIRNESELEAARRYVRENPLRWALDRENPANL